MKTLHNFDKLSLNELTLMVQKDWSM